MREQSRREFEPSMQIENQIAKEFEVFTQKHINNLQVELQEMITEEFISEEEAEKMKQKAELELANLTFEQQVSKLTNNFYTWWPGGIKRKQFETSKDTTANPEEQAYKQKLIEDIDNSITKNRFESELELVQTKNTSGSEALKRAKVIAQSFFELTDNGYDPLELRK